MSPYYRRKKPGSRENAGAALAALGVAAGVAGVTFYLVRLMLSREALVPSKPSELPAPPSRSLSKGHEAPEAEVEDQA